MSMNSTGFTRDWEQSSPEGKEEAVSSYLTGILEEFDLKDVYASLMEECATELMFERYCSALATLLQNESSSGTVEHKRAMNDIAQRCGVVLLPYPEIEEK